MIKPTHLPKGQKFQKGPLPSSTCQAYPGILRVKLELVDTIIMIERTEYFRTSLFYFSVNAVQTWYLKTREICALTVLGATSSKSRCLHGHAFPPKSLRENPSLFLPAVGYAWCVTASVSFCLLLSFFPESQCILFVTYKNILLGFRALLNTAFSQIHP